MVACSLLTTSRPCLAGSSSSPRPGGLPPAPRGRLRPRPPHPFLSSADANIAGCGLGDRDGLLPLPVPAGELPLVSAVDVYYRGAPLLSSVVETPASLSWFLTSLFHVEAVEPKKPPPAAAAAPSPAELELSWVVVDPARGHAVNISSRWPVAVDRHWYMGETLARFGVALGGCKFEATVACSEWAACGHAISEVSLAVEDADGGKEEEHGEEAT